MGFYRKSLSVLLASVILFGMFMSASIVSYAGNIPTEKEFIQKMILLEKKYKDGSKWTGEYKENGAAQAWQCMGYASQLAYETFGSTQYTKNTKWSKSTSMGTVYAGDMVRIGNSKGPDRHTIFITKTEGNNIYYTDCNWVGKDTVRWNGVYTKSELKSRFTYKWHLGGNNLTGNHACTKGKSAGISKEHPHYDLYVCSICSKTWADKSKTHSMIDSCELCQPTPETPILKYEKIRGKVTLSWQNCKNANFYNIYVYDYDGNKVFEKLKFKNTSLTLSIESGEYYAFCESAYSDIKNAQSDYAYFDYYKTDSGDIGDVQNSVEYNGNTYELYCYDADRYAAKDFCEQRGGHLVTIADSGEWNTVKELLSGYEYGTFWTGGSYENGKGKWPDSAEFIFDNFGERSNESGYIIIDGYDDCKWDVMPSDDAYFILEREKGSINPLDLEITANGDGSVKISKYNGNAKEIIIPSVMNGKRVSAIADDAFTGDEITAITVPDSVTEIGTHALGYRYISGEYVKADNFTVNCRSNAAAYKYAADNGISVNLLPELKPGDANENGKTTAADVLLIRQYVAGQRVTINWTAADVNRDGKVTSSDVLMIRKMIAGQRL